MILGQLMMGVRQTKNAPQSGFYPKLRVCPVFKTDTEGAEILESDDPMPKNGYS